MCSCISFVMQLFIIIFFVAVLAAVCSQGCFAVEASADKAVSGKEVERAGFARHEAQADPSPKRGPKFSGFGHGNGNRYRDGSAKPKVFSEIFRSLKLNIFGSSLITLVVSAATNRGLL